MARCVGFLAAAAALVSAQPYPPSTAATLQAELQKVLDETVLLHGRNVAVQLGWKSTDMDFSLVSGVVDLPKTGGTRPATLDDTFLFGSGTKPLTAVAIMKLRDDGKLSLDDSLEAHLDPLLTKLKPGTTVRSLFGANASKITIGHVVRMQSGVQDFDVPAFDNFLLAANETYRVHSPLEFVEFASTQKPPLLCDPGSCVSYSSNNFVIAGLVLLAHANVETWEQLDLASLLPEAAQKSLGKAKFYKTENLTQYLTVPGHSGGGWAKTPKTEIWNQSSTILGWTCGNMVGTASDMARFMWSLLGPEGDILPAATLEEMKQFKLLDLGWAKGSIRYGAGLMVESVAEVPPVWGHLGSYMGHGGDTYGFLSEQGILAQLNASLSIVANEDSDGIIVQRQAFCKTIKVAAKVLLGQQSKIRCMLPEDDAEDAEAVVVMV